MLVVAVFNSVVTGISVRSVEIRLTSTNFPTLLFCAPLELISRDEFKEHVVKIVAKSFQSDLNELHTVFIVWRDDIVRKWRFTRGRLKDIKI